VCSSDLAIQLGERLIEQDSAMPFARGWLSFAYLDQGDHQKAIDVASAEPVSFSRLTSLASIHGALGNHDEAQEAQQKLLEEYGDLAAFQQAVIFAYWGDYDKCVEYLELGFEVRDPGMGLVKTPLFHVLNDHPGYQAILKKMDLVDD
jgi:tetratricopeptide (TPR) repeat protein